MRKQVARLTASVMILLVVPSAVAELNIAFVDSERALLNSDKARSVDQQLAEEFKEEQENIRKIASEVAALKQRLQEDQEVMDDAEKQKLSREIEEKTGDFTFYTQKLQRQVQDRQAELFVGMDIKFRKAIEELVISEDYDMILPGNDALFIGSLYDVTHKVIEKLNEIEKLEETSE